MPRPPIDGRNIAEPRGRAGVGLGFTIGRNKPKRPRKRNDLDWETGIPIPNTLDHWVLCAYRRKAGVVLSAAKVRELVERLGLQPRATPARETS